MMAGPHPPRQHSPRSARQDWLALLRSRSDAIYDADSVMLAPLIRRHPRRRTLRLYPSQAGWHRARKLLVRLGRDDVSSAGHPLQLRCPRAQRGRLGRSRCRLVLERDGRSGRRRCGAVVGGARAGRARRVGAVLCAPFLEALAAALLTIGRGRSSSRCAWP